MLQHVIRLKGLGGWRGGGRMGGAVFGLASLFFLSFFLFLFSFFMFISAQITTVSLPVDTSLSAKGLHVCLCTGHIFDQSVICDFINQYAWMLCDHRPCM